MQPFPSSVICRLLLRGAEALAIASTLLILAVHGLWTDERPAENRWFVASAQALATNYSAVDEAAQAVARTQGGWFADVELRAKALEMVRSRHPKMSHSTVEIFAYPLRSPSVVRVEGLSKESILCRVYVDELLTQWLDQRSKFFPLPEDDFDLVLEQVLQREAQIKKLSHSLKSLPANSQRFVEEKEDLKQAAEDYLYWKGLYEKADPDQGERVTTIDRISIIKWAGDVIEIPEGYYPVTLAQDHPLAALLCMGVGILVALLTPLPGCLRKGGTPSLV